MEGLMPLNAEGTFPPMDKPPDKPSTMIPAEPSADISPTPTITVKIPPENTDEADETDEAEQSGGADEARESETPEATTEVAEETAPPEESSLPMPWRIAGALALVVTVAAAIAVVSGKRKKQAPGEFTNVSADNMPIEQKPPAPRETIVTYEPRPDSSSGAVYEQPTDAQFRIANLHHIGMRENQQDSFGVSDLSDRLLVQERGVLAVVADGMGGLSGGAEISAIVTSYMLSAFQSSAGDLDLPSLMLQMVTDAHAEVLRYLERSGEESGSTVVAAAVKDGMLYFISVGDSRIYLLRGGRMTLLTREHTYGSELDEMAARGEISREEANRDPQRAALTSYIGMPDALKVDRNLKPVRLNSNDAVLLMSDGVFGTVTDSEIQSAFTGNDIYEAAAVLERLVLSKQKQHQDNFTAVVISII